MLRYLSYFILLFIPVCGFCQIDLNNYSIEHHGLTVEEPFHTGVEIYEDSLGHLTSFSSIKKNATQTFNGTIFKNEVIGQKDERFLKNEDDTQWFVKSAFLLCFNRGGETDTLDVRDYVDRNISFLRKHNEHYYLFSNDGIILFDIVKGEISVIESFKYAIDRIVDAHFVGDTIYIDSHRDPEYILMTEPTKLVSFSNPGVSNNNIFQLTNSRILVPSRNGLVTLGVQSSMYQFLIRQKKSLMSYIDSSNRLWCSLRNDKFLGVYILEDGETTPTEMKIKEVKWVTSFYEDRLGDMWIGTSGQGIFQIYTPTTIVQNRERGLISDNIFSIAKSYDETTYYYGTGCQGIDVLENNKVVDHILGTNCQTSILSDSQGRLWLTSNGVKLYVKGKPIINYDRTAGLHSRTVSSLFEDSKGDIWAGTRQVLHKYEDDRFIKFQIPGLDTYDRIFNIVEKENGEFLLAISNNSFYRFDGTNFYKVDSPNVNSMQLFKDLEGKIWLATDGQGLYLYEGNMFAPIKSSAQEMKSISFLQDSPNGLMFGISSENYIFYAKKEDLINDEDPEINVLTKDDGLPLIDLNTQQQPSTALLKNGHIVFPNIYGAIKINSEKLLEEKKGFHSVIRHQDSIVYSSILKLPFGEDDVTLNIDNLYLNPQATIVNEYSINDGPFIEIDKANQLILKRLSPGYNRLVFRSKHISGDWMPSIDMIVHRRHFLYERWWFQLAVLMFIIGLVTLFVKWRTSIVKTQNVILESKVQKQTQELQNEKAQLAESLKAQKILTHELNVSQESKNRMYAQISHEFKSPLQAINVHLSNGENAIFHEDKIRIKNNIQNLLSISNEIMELSKAESGALKVKKNYYNINGVIDDQIGLKLPLIEKKGIQIVHHSKNELQYLLFDISLIQKVMNNLLSNAIKFSPKGGVITIKSTIDSDRQIIEVIDQGPGIPTEEIENLTLAYYQASNNTKDGTGIGLSLVDKILKLHKSKLTIKSKLGEGSNFSFELARPQIPQHQIIKENLSDLAIVSQVAQIIDQNKPIILAVDDSIDVLYFINHSLSKKYNVITASNGREALDYLDLVNPKAIISDYNMPIMDGIEFLKKVREIPKYTSVPFLILTGSLSEEKELRSISQGADIILRKPIQVDLLLTQVGQLLVRQKNISDSIKTGFAHDLLPTNIHNDDLIIMQQLETVFLEHIDNGKLKSEEIAAIVGLGEKTLRNRVKTITGLTIKEYFRNYRLEKAKLLLDEGYGTMGEVATATGFSSLSYFSKCYKKYFSE